MCMCVAWHEERLLFTASENSCGALSSHTDSERKMLADHLSTVCICLVDYFVHTK